MRMRRKALFMCAAGTYLYEFGGKIMSTLERHEGKTVFLADMAMLGAALFWGSGFAVTDRLLNSCSPLWLLTFRFVPSGMLLSLVFWKRLRRISRRDFLRGSLLGVFLFTVFLAHIYGLVLSTPGKQSFLAGANVVIVPFLYALFYRIWPSKWAFTAAGLTTAGILTMAFTPGMQFNLGDTFSLILAFGVALHCIFVGNLTRKMDSCALTALQISGAAVCFLGAALLLEPFPAFANGGRDLLWGIPYVALFVTVIPFLIQTVAQRYSPEVHAAILLSMESLFGYIIAIFMGQESLHLQIVFGGLLILGGVFTAELETYLAKRSASLDLLGKREG